MKVVNHSAAHRHLYSSSEIYGAKLVIFFIQMQKAKKGRKILRFVITVDERAWIVNKK